MSRDGQTSQTEYFLSRDELTAMLEGQILRGELPAGTRLPSERQLAEKFGVSRPIVREVLRTLSERGLLEVRPGRGSFVRQARATDMAGRLDTLYRRRQATPRDLVEARTSLECSAVMLACQRATPNDLRMLKQALQRFDQSPTVLDQARYDLAFHLAIARASGNPVIETMFGSIATLTFEMMLRSMSDPDVKRVSIPYHVVIYQAILERNAEQARKAMADHLAVASMLYGADYDQSIEHVTPRLVGHIFAAGVTLEDLLAPIDNDE